MAQNLIVGYNLETDKVRVYNPKNPKEAIPCRYVGLIEEEIMPFSMDVLRPCVLENINPDKNFMWSTLNDMDNDESPWEMAGRIHFGSDGLTRSGSKYIALHHEFSGVPSQEYDAGFPRAYYLGTSIFYDIAREKKTYLLLTEAFLDPQIKRLDEINAHQDIWGFMKDLTASITPSKHLPITVHAHLVTFERATPVAKSWSEDFKTDEDGYAKKAFKKVLTRAASGMDKRNQKDFIRAFMALSGAIYFHPDTLDAAYLSKTVAGTRLRSHESSKSLLLGKMNFEKTRG